MGIISNGLKGLIIGYIALVGYLIFTRVFVPGCQCNPKKQNCEKVCVSPFWALRETRIDVRIWVGQTVADRSLVWAAENHSIADRTHANVSFAIPDGLSREQDRLLAWMDFSISGADKSVPKISLNFSIAEKRRYFKRRQTRNLLDADSSASDPSLLETEEAEDDYGLHWKFQHAPMVLRYVEMHAVTDARTYSETMAVPMLMRVWKKTPATDGAMQQTRRMYDPVLWLDDLAITTRHFVPFTNPNNETNTDANMTSALQSRKNMTFEFQFVPTSVLHFFVKKILELNMGMIASMTNGSEDALDEIRYYLSEDKLFTLLLTQVIGWVHIVLEYLAFQDDWKFFRGRKNFKGVSSSSLIYSLFRSIVIFLYLHHQETSWLVLGTLAKDIVYETWKLHKIFQPQLEWYALFGFLSIPYSVRIRNISVEGDDEEQKCSSYDHIASLHAGLCLYPMVIGLSVYYLKTYTYSSWYSWFISSAVDCVYFFGFLAMLPQLYINYKLQSVAHLPMKAFVYKIFNTFIDDIFAFIVKMPLKHKIMTLRDDLVFFGFIYQWWIYPADKARTNEFGFQYDDAIDNDTATMDRDSETEVGERRLLCPADIVRKEEDLNSADDANDAGANDVNAEKKTHNIKVN